jgi:hypothetical protein
VAYDDVKSEGGFNHVTDFAGLQSERRVRELLDHGRACESAKVPTALCCARLIRELRHQLAEIFSSAGSGQRLFST